MTLNEIKAAIAAGRKVHWKSPFYTVIRDSIGQYLIVFMRGSAEENSIGLTWQDGVTLNGREHDFYTA